jgi:hypothetical protein
VSKAEQPKWKLPSVALVAWRDASGRMPGWHPRDQAAATEPATCYSTGFLLSSDEVGIRLAQDMGFNTDEPDEDAEANGIGVIPRACVVWMKVLRK